MKIDIDNIQYNYQHQSGVVIGDEFLDYDNFKIAFKSMLLNSEGYNRLRQNMHRAKKIIHITKTPMGTIGVPEYVENISQIVKEFSQFMGGLGGQISLLTTFSFGNKFQRTYFLSDEEDLPSHENLMNERTYENTRQILIKMEKENKNLELLDNVFKKHLTEFSNQLKDPSAYSKDNFINLRIWSYQNLPRRYKAYQKGTMHSISYSDYFWGKGQVHGFISEAYGTHLSLVHPNALVGKHIELLKTSVIKEHGGFGNSGLFELLSATKGNTESQLSGDIVIIDKDGRVRFNIQSKASTLTKYNIHINYTAFMQKMEMFIRIYDKYIDNIDKVSDEDVQFLFKIFKTSAWTPIQEELQENVERLVDDEVLNKIISSI